MEYNFFFLLVSRTWKKNSKIYITVIADAALNLEQIEKKKTKQNKVVQFNFVKQPEMENCKRKYTFAFDSIFESANSSVRRY